MTKNAQVTVPEIIDSVEALTEDGCNARGSESICNLYPGAGR